MRKALVPLVAGLLGLAGTLGATLYLHRAANAALDRVLEERILGAGETAAEMVGRSIPSTATLRAVMDANQLEGMFLLSPDLVVLADATGSPGRRADLLRVDRGRGARALAGEQSLAFSYRRREREGRDRVLPRSRTPTGSRGRCSRSREASRSRGRGAASQRALRGGLGSPRSWRSTWRSSPSAGREARSTGGARPRSLPRARRFPAWPRWWRTRSATRSGPSGERPNWSGHGARRSSPVPTGRRSPTSWARWSGSDA